MAEKKDSRLKRAGVSGYNKPKRTPSHPKKSHIVVAKEGGKTKLIRLGVNDNYVNSGSYEYLKNKYKLTEKHVSRVILDKIKN